MRKPEPHRQQERESSRERHEMHDVGPNVPTLLDFRNEVRGPDIEEVPGRKRHQKSDVIALLKDNGVPEKQIYVVAKQGVEIEDLPDAGPEGSDFVPAYERGLAIGGAAGLLAGVFALIIPPSGLVIGGGAVLLFGLYGAGFGGLLSALAGSAFASSRLKSFEEAIDEGKLLVMADVPADRVERFEALIRSFDPATEVKGVGPPAPIVP